MDKTIWKKRRCSEREQILKNQKCLGLTIDNDAVYCAGWAEGNFIEKGAGNTDAFVVKLSKEDGSTIWAKQLGKESLSQFGDDIGTDSQSCNDVVVDSSGVYCGGTTYGSFIEPNSGADFFMMKLNINDGGIIWVKHLGRNSAPSEDAVSRNDYCQGVAINDDAVFCAGSTDGSLGEENGGGRDFLVTRFNKTNGNIDWIKQFGKDSELVEDGSSGSDECYSLAADSNAIYCGGKTRGGFGEPNGGNDDAVVLKLGSDIGNLIWVKQVGKVGKVSLVPPD